LNPHEGLCQAPSVYDLRLGNNCVMFVNGSKIICPRLFPIWLEVNRDGKCPFYNGVKKACGALMYKKSYLYSFSQQQIMVNLYYYCFQLRKALSSAWLCFSFCEWVIGQRKLKLVPSTVKTAILRSNIAEYCSAGLK